MSASLGGNGSGITASSLTTGSSSGPPALARLCIHNPWGVPASGSPPAATMAWNRDRNTGVMKFDSDSEANMSRLIARGT